MPASMDSIRRDPELAQVKIHKLNEELEESKKTVQILKDGALKENVWDANLAVPLH